MTIIGERGFRAFSLSELARRCGLTNAGLLHHFASKELLLVALLEQRDLDDQHAIEAQMRCAADHRAVTLDDVIAALDAVMERNERRPELVRLSVVLGAEALINDHPAHAFFRRREARTIDALSRVLTGLVADPAIAARRLAALMHGLEVQWLRSDRAFELHAAWREAVGAMLPPRAAAGE